MKPLILSNKPADVIKNAESDQDDDGQLQKALVKRLLWASLAIVILLAALAWFESWQRPTVAPEQEKAGNAGEPEVREIVKSMPLQTETTAAEPPAAVASGEEGESEKAEEKPPTSMAEVEETTAVSRSPAPHALTPLMPPLSRAAPGEAKLPVPAKTGKPIQIQVGVFSDHANAEALLARLREASIPAHIESRVLVGPFASRAEAEAARAKLKRLGIEETVPIRR